MNVNEPKIPDPAEALKEARLKAVRLAQSFADVFGIPKKRSAAQALVLDHLAMCAGEGGNSYRFNEAKDGIAIIGAGIHRDGAQSMLRVIQRQIDISLKVEDTKPKTKAKR